MSLNTDLAIELYKENLSEEHLNGTSVKEYTDDDAELRITEIEILTPEAGKAVGKPMGKYITLESDTPLYDYSPALEARIHAVTRAISAVCARGVTMFAGLGNRNITPDCLGAFAADRIFATRHIKRLAKEIDSSDLTDTSVFAPGVMAQTGIETAEAISALCEKIKPRQVIVCDSLACSDPFHMGKTIQISSTGISPGSGVDNSRAEISEKTLRVPVAAIGIPTVSRLMSGDKRFDGLIVTPKPIDRLVQRGADMIAAAVNAFLHPKLSADEITSLLL